MKTLKTLFPLQEREILWCGKILLGGFLLLQGIICAIMILLRPEESVLLTGSLAPLILCFCLVMLGMQNITCVFESGLAMGRTRREMAGAALKLALLELVLAGLLCGALIVLERLVCIQLWALLAGRPGAVIMMEAPGGGQLWEPIFDTGVLRIEDFSLPFWMDPLILLGGSVLGFVGGAVSQRFGGGWSAVIYLPLWAVILSRTALADDQYDTLLTWLPGGLILLLAGGSLWAVWSLLHAEVRK